MKVKDHQNVKLTIHFEGDIHIYTKFHAKFIVIISLKAKNVNLNVTLEEKSGDQQSLLGTINVGAKFHGNQSNRDRPTDRKANQQTDIAIPRASHAITINTALDGKCAINITGNLSY